MGHWWVVVCIIIIITIIIVVVITIIIIITTTTIIIIIISESTMHLLFASSFVCVFPRQYHSASLVSTIQCPSLVQFSALRYDDR